MAALDRSAEGAADRPGRDHRSTAALADWMAMIRDIAWAIGMGMVLVWLAWVFVTVLW
jgi:hypothetical protein